MHIEFATELPLGLHNEALEGTPDAYPLTEVMVSAYLSEYIPAKINADPDDCYEASGGCVEDLEVTVGETGEAVRLTANWARWIEDETIENL